MKTSSSLFLIIATITASLLTACHTTERRGVGKTSAATAPDTALRELNPPQGGVMKAGTNLLTSHNFTPPVKRRNISEEGPQFLGHLSREKEVELGVDAVAKAMESMSNIVAWANYYGISAEIRDALVARLVPQLAIKAPPVKQPQTGGSSQGWVPFDWGTPQPTEEQQLQKLKAKEYGRKSK